MNYPIWELTGLGGGNLIAFISVLHAYIAHLAVGGGLFLWLTDLKAYKENSDELNNYVRKHTWFFLLLTMVFGGVTGVGIWFIIALVSPAGTSLLIHNFVFGWAIEWVFFIGEITALLIYHYKFDDMDRKSRLNIAFLYFLFAWLSMVIINGILSFMLTPGTWLETSGFWDGFFNPTYFPSLIFRSAAAVMIAGLFGYVTVVFMKESGFRSNMLKYCGKWVLYPVPFIFLGGLWYYYSVPENIRITTFQLNAQTSLFVTLMIICSILIFLFAAYYILRSSTSLQRVAVFVLIIIGLGWYGGFEYIRELARKPYVINEYMYSTSILKSDVDLLNKEGVLTHAKWTAVKEIASDNMMEAGRELFNIECLSCHTINGIRNDIVEKTKTYTYLGMLSQLTGQGKILDYMPEFVGTKSEMEALAYYIVKGLQNKEVTKELDQYQPEQAVNEIPPFDQKESPYVLLVWNDLGMHCISDSDPWFVILPPANTLEAQLIKRGEVPEIVTEGIELRYKVQKGFENPSKHVKFWDYAESTFGKEIPKDIGLNGNGMSGKFAFDDVKECFVAATIPAVPYLDDGSFNPYPQFTVEAVDLNTGEVIASTKVVAPASTEMGCRNCHGGDWRFNGISGLSDETAVNILLAHDRLSGTNLYEEALAGEPKLCQSCHADPALGAEGKPGINNLSASIHGWHANYMFEEGGKACVLCHPASGQGNTRCNRGIHPQLGLSCNDCHGKMSDHAISLLNNQLDNPSSGRMLARLVPMEGIPKEEINPRMPWLNEPDCLGCHEDFAKPPDGYTGFNKWSGGFEELYRVRTDDVGIKCAACHNSTHSIYPARNAFGINWDNTQPMQYMGKPFPIGSNNSCEVCHMQKMEYPVHHENMDGMFRNVQTAIKEKLITQ